MPQTSTYDALISHQREIEALSQVSGVIGWDQETMMPRKGATQRAEHAAALATVIHERQTDRRMTAWLQELDETDLDPMQTRNVAEIRRSHARAMRIPAALSAEIARQRSAAHLIWSDARAANDFAAFAPALATVLTLKREEATCLREEGQSLYDALIDEFEPGMTADRLNTLLTGLRPHLSALRAAIAEKDTHPAPLDHRFEEGAQLALAKQLAETFGYDFAAGRIDLAVHPFSSGTMGDTRITTRVDTRDPFNCIFSTIHEVGHAVYEQNIDADLMFQPVGNHVSMGVHESQSRMLENQMGRSRPFADWLYGAMRDAFGDFGVASAEDLYRIINRVETGFIRTEADEVHYNLHVLLRFELERDLISGDLDVDALETEWNHRFARDFGRDVPDAARGVLQDVHWSEGLFGYFPTYSLGNIYAAELFAAMRADIPDMDDRLARGDLSTPVSWLTQQVHQRGNRMPPEALVEQAIGHAPQSGPLLDYLDTKFSALYVL